MVDKTTIPLSSLLPKPRPLLDICNETFHRLLASIAASNAHPIEHAIVAADLRSKTILLAVLLPDRFEALRAAAVSNSSTSSSRTVESSGVDYPIAALVEPPGNMIRLMCEEREWTELFTPDGRALMAEPKVKDEVVFRRVELLRCLAEVRRLERKRMREGRRSGEAARLSRADEDMHGDGDEMEEKEEEGEGEEDVRARRRQRLREKDRRQRARRREEAARARELERLENEVIQEGVTAEELSRGFRLVDEGSDEYFDALAEAKKLGLKVVRL